MTTTSDIFKPILTKVIFQSTSNRFFFLSKYVENICQLTSVEVIFWLTLVESIFKLMLARFFYQRQLGFVWPTPARVFSNDIDQGYF